MFEMRFLFVLIAIFILEPTHQQYQRSVPKCTLNGETFCWSCSTASRCISSAGTVKQYNTNCTGSTPLCGPDASNPPKYGCTGNAIADCSCTGTGLTYKSDPYSDQWYILCVGTTATYIDCGAGFFYNEAGHNCVDYTPAPTTTTTTTTTTPAPSICTVSGAGVHDYPDTCDSFYVCTSATADPINGICDVPTNYFDPGSNECRELPTLFQCPPGGIGTFGDPFDCRRYYVCFEEDLFDVGCCLPTEVYSEQAETCITSTAPVGCPLSDECAVTETTDVTIASTSASTSPNSLTSTTTSPSTSTPDGITATSTTTSSSTSTPDGITSTSTTTSSSTSTPDVITSTSTTTSSSTSTPDGITSTSTTTSSSISTPDGIASTSTTTSPSTSTPDGITSTSTPDGITSTSTATSPSTSTFTSTSTTISTTTNQVPSCTPISSFVCPAPDGFFPHCNYCARTYFRCVSGSATQGTCTGSTVFNTVPTYPSCLSPEFCPYYP